jgi:parallel beta-helix repeat protein
VIIDVTVDITQNVKGTTLYVNMTGSGGAYTKIQDAINAAFDGDTVYVYSGTYFENVVVNKTINLTGENRNNTIIDGGGSGDVVHVSVDKVNISGFSVTNSGSAFGPSFDSGIDIRNSENCRIFNNLALFNNNVGIIAFGSGSINITENIVTNNNIGLYLYQSYESNMVKNEVHTFNAYGIMLFSSTGNMISGNNVSDSEKGIRIVASSENDFKYNNVSNNNYGIYLESTSIENNITFNNISSNSKEGIHHVKSDFNYVANNTLSNNVLGIAIYTSSGNTLRDNIMEKDGIFIDGLYIEYWNTHDIDTSNIVNNKPIYFYKNQTGITVPNDAGQIILANCNNMIIEDQHINECYAGIELGFSSNNTLTGNNVSSNHRYGIFMRDSNDNGIFGNNASKTISGFVLDSCSSNEILNNTALFNSIHGIMLIYSSINNTLTGNEFSHSQFGIHNAQSSHGAIIINNTILNNSNMGISIESSSNCQASYNMVMDCDMGFRIFSTTNSNISNNNIKDNQEGITAIDSSANLIYHNNIISNIDQAIDYSGTNFWNHTYPSGGNFWSDYEGEDKFNGPDQDNPGSDGIGDTNYSIEIDSVDHYPLITPIGNYISLYPGWNLISIPNVVADTNMDSVLRSIKGSYDAVQWYNSSDNYNHWKHNSTNKIDKLNDLNELDYSSGFWIHITEPGRVLFEYHGTQPSSNQSIHLHQGWNMVGYPSLKSYNRTGGLNNLTFDTHVDAIWTYNAATQKYKELTESDYFVIGKGYYIHAKAECTWVVPL